MTGVSATTAMGTVVIGVTGVIMITLGGRAIVDGTMTLGDFIMYIFFTGLVAAPLISIASIGTQITEAFAGLDRIHEIKKMATEDAEDHLRQPLVDVQGRVAFEDVWFEYNEGVPVIKGVSFEAAAGSTTALVGSRSPSTRTTRPARSWATRRCRAGRGGRSCGGRPPPPRFRC